MKKKVADLIADFLTEHGVENVFTVTGGGAMHLNDAFGHRKDIKCVYNHHEQGSAIACEGYVRSSGRPCAICVTSGPGGTNALTGVVGSWLDSIPVFVISGQVKYSTTMKSVPQLNLRQFGDQEFNIVDCVKPMTKYAVMVEDENTVLYHLQKAWTIMSEGRPGPVWLDVPLNIQGAIVETDRQLTFGANELPIPEYDEFGLKEAAELLKEIKKAKRPVIMGGTAIDNVRYVGEFRKFCERLNVPVVTAWNAHDIIYDEHYLYCGRPGTVGTRGGNFVVQNSDLLLVIGSQLNIRQISYNYENFAKSAKIIYVDFDENEIKKPTLNIYKAICCDLRRFIDVCISDIGFYADNHKEWLAYARKVNSRYPVAAIDRPCKNGVLNPYRFIDRFSRLCADDDAVVCGNGTACVVTFQGFFVKKHQRIFTNSGCASMGYGLPAAIGSAVARRGDRVICFEGDGSLQMNLQELGTMSFNKLNVKLLVLNNGGYHSIRQTQNNLFHGRALCGINEESGLGFPKLEKIAEAYSIPFFRLSSEDDIQNVVKAFLASENCAILEVMLDEEQAFEPKLSSKVLPDGTIVSPSLEDMYPFLSEEEIKDCMTEIEE